MVPHLFHRVRKPVLRTALAAAVLLTPAAVAATSVAPAHAADDPTVTLTGPNRVRTYEYENRIWTDFGLRFRVMGQALELWSHRADYDSEVQVTQKLEGGDVALPSGITDTVGGLSGFVRAKFVPLDSDGTVDEDRSPFNRKLDGCIGGAAARIVPDGEFKSPYPQGCYYNPFALGSVQGIPAGWSGSVLQEYTPEGIKVRPGTYRVTAQIAKAYADALGLPWSERRAELTLVVEDSRDECRRGCRAPHGGDLADPTPLVPEATEPKGPGVGSLEDLPEGTPVPDLRSLPAFGIELNRKGTQLRFSANVWNGGTSDLVVDGFRRESEDVMDAYQYFLDDQGEVVAYEPVGEMEWDPDPTHRHWHFTDFATYRLLAADMETEVVSGKEAFCLANTDAVDLTGPGANWTVSYDDLGSVCGGKESQAIREVLAAGWGDTYAQFRAGQAFPIANVADGVYYIQVLANPESNLIEADTDNNEALRKIRLSTTPGGERRVKVFPVGLVEETEDFFR